MSRILPVGGRATFGELRQSRNRARRGEVRVNFVPKASGSEVEVGYAIGRAVGNAVVRNKIRRRLRVIVVSVVDLRPGAYLVGVSPGAGHLSFNELRNSVLSAIQAATGVDRAAR